MLGTTAFDIRVIRRTAASAALLAGLAVAVAGCAFVTPQASTLHYGPTDGVEANVGDLQLRGFVAISNGDGTANLVGSIANESDQTVQIQLQYVGTGDLKRYLPVTVKPSGVTAVGYDGAQAAMELTEKPGDTVPLYLQYNEFPGEQVQVPVLAADQEQFSTLLPTPEPTVSSTEAPTPAPTATN